MRSPAKRQNTSNLRRIQKWSPEAIANHRSAMLPRAGADKYMISRVALVLGEWVGGLVELAEIFRLQQSLGTIRPSRFVSCRFFQVPSNSVNDVDWTGFTLLVNAANILADHTDEKQQHTGEKGDRHN